MGVPIHQMVNALKSHKRFLMKLLGHHKFYQEVYVKNGGRSHFSFAFNTLQYAKFTSLTTINFSIFYEVIEKEIILLAEADIITTDEATTLRNMIWHTEDEDNILIRILLLKKYRKFLDKMLKDPTFESEFTINILFNYYEKLHKTYMARKLRLNKKKE